MSDERGFRTTSIVWTLAGVAVLVAAVLFTVDQLKERPGKFDTPYQCVLLTNGSVYFGKLEGYGTKYPVLRDVYYVTSQTNPDTKEVKNVLVKRGKELHSPDRMVLNPNHIILVEPVGGNSKVAELIRESKADQ